MLGYEGQLCGKTWVDVDGEHKLRESGEILLNSCIYSCRFTIQGNLLRNYLAAKRNS